MLYTCWKMPAYKVIVKGRGKVREQSIPPGSRLVKGEKIILTMSFS